ncbi:DUF456 domain-containing protein [Gordonia sp. DT30]|uniref:DUF456 domain-containing protein n=1 Tax=unclassified Gordonia (in: high G+C Gram-positive bacteria) TaxID=2657482 RepID=UPI003CEC0C5E
MPIYGEVLVGLGIGVGLLAIVIPVLPGSLVVVASILVWAWVIGGYAWAVFAVAAALIGLGWIVKYLVAGRFLRGHEIPNRTIVVGGVVGIVGFFVLPVIGLFVGFVLGAMASELVRTRTTTAAWRGTLAATTASAYTIGIELSASLLAAGVWLTGALLW